MTDFIRHDVEISFLRTKQSITANENYPETSGIYAIFLSEKSNLSGFGDGNKIVYIGIAKHSLRDRDFNQHFRTGQTGRSTLRRSIGAILKDKLGLTAIPRGGINDGKRFDNFKFNQEQRLTDWMVSNLEIGYWTPKCPLSYQELRNVEKKITMYLKPTLDLDNRTSRFNPLANKLNKLREVCKREARL